MKVSSSYARPQAQEYAAAGDTIPFMVDNEYHLFHLASPPDTLHHPSRVRCAWVRQKSQDLVNWKRDALPVLPPGNGDDAPDRDGSWTGSAVIGPDGNMQIFYTGYNLAQGGKQVILHSRSTSRDGDSFEKPKGPIAIKEGHLERYEATDFRDPYVFFNDDEQCFWMLVATRLSEGPYWTRGCVALLTSSDLETWNVEPEPLFSPNNIFCPECPELFTLGNGKWYLIYSDFGAPYAGTRYHVSDSPRGPFRFPRDCSGGRLDGRRWYAAKSCPKANSPGKRVMFGWVHDYATGDEKWLWGGTLVQPRELSSNPDGTLRLGPCPESMAVLKAQGASASPTSIKVSSVGSTAVQCLDQVSTPRPGLRQSLTFSFSTLPVDTRSFGLLLNYDDDMRGYRISIQHVAAQSYTVSILTDQPPLDDFWADLTKHAASKTVDGAELVRHGAVSIDGELRLLITDDIIEFFIGGKVLTTRLLARGSEKALTNGHAPSSLDIKTVGFFVEDGEVQFDDVQYSEA